MQRYLIVAAAFACIAPVPWKTPQASAQTPGNSQHQSAPNGPPATPPAPINGPIQAGSPAHHGGQAGTADKEQKVKVVSLPTVSIAQPTKNLGDQVLQWGPWLFNFGLVIVGALQVWLLLRTRDEIKRQADWIERQAGHMEEQTRILKASVDTSQASANAAQKSANAALAQIELMKDGERPRFQIELEDFKFMPHVQPLWLQKVNYKIRMHGPTEAFNVKSQLFFCLGEPEKILGFRVGFGSTNLPTVVTPTENLRVGEAAIYFESASGVDFKSWTVGSLKASKESLYCAGFVEFTDRFSQRWRLPFKRRWVFQDSSLPFVKPDSGFWVEECPEEHSRVNQ